MSRILLADKIEMGENQRKHDERERERVRYYNSIDRQTKDKRQGKEPERGGGNGGGREKTREVVRGKERVTAMRVLQVGRRRPFFGVQTQGQVADWGPVGWRKRPWVPRKATRTARQKEHGNLTFGRGQHP